MYGKSNGVRSIPDSNSGARQGGVLAPVSVLTRTLKSSPPTFDTPKMLTPQKC